MSIRKYGGRYWGSRRYQRKIFGKGDSDDITIGREVRLCLKKQHIRLCVTSHTKRDITLLDSKTGRVNRVRCYRNHLINRYL